MRQLIALIACAGVLVGSTCSAYDAETHGAIMYEAFQRSALADWYNSEALSNLSLNHLDKPGPFDTYWGDPSLGIPFYFDDFPLLDPNEDPLIYPPLEVAYMRLPSNYEQCQMQHLEDNAWIDVGDPMLVGENVVHLPIQNWLIRGDVREDDILGIQYATFAHEVCGRPDPDPHGEITRVMNHFYDPVHDVPLSSGCADLAPGGVCKKSIDWALGYIDSFDDSPQIDPDRQNHFSYADARNNMWLALVGDRNAGNLPYTSAARSIDAEERLWRWATTFRALGDVVHLLQDGAQPQHVRNDPHSTFQSAEQQAFEGYTNARVYSGQDPSIYVRGFFHGENVPLPPRLVTGTYPIPQFSTPLRFFTTRRQSDGPEVHPDDRYGLMDYANRGFFTGGTLPGSSSTFLEPPYPIDEDSFYTDTEVPCRMSTALSGRILASCHHWTHSVLDSVEVYTDELPHEDGQASPFSEPPLLAQTVLFQPMNEYAYHGSLPQYSVGVEEFQNMANLAVPRAIAYSAGLIDYFFRGKIALSAPPDGLYAVLDQGTPHAVSDGIPLLSDGSNKVFGFTTLRVRAKNATGDENGEMIESGSGRVVPQNMHGGLDSNANKIGKLVAIARYHRNPCYQADLSGESSFQEPTDPLDATVPAGCSSAAQLRTPYAEISASAPIFIDETGNLPGFGDSQDICANVGNINTGVGPDHPECASEDGALLEFDFSNDPIPANATDLYLQVAYRGPLGEEQDSIAVGIRDILEPAYYTLLNTTDWFLYDNQWIPPNQAPEGTGAEPDSLNLVEFCLHDQQIAHLKPDQQLPAGQFARVAILSEKQDLYMGTIARFSRDDPSARVWTYLGPPSSDLVRESTQDNGGIYDDDPMYYGRGTTLGFGHSFMFHYYPDADLTGTHYDELWNLTPALGTADAPGIATEIATQFTGMSDGDDCGATYGGQWPDAYFAPNGNGSNVQKERLAPGISSRVTSTGAAASSRQ